MVAPPVVKYTRKRHTISRQQTRNQRCDSCHIGAKATETSNVVTDARCGGVHNLHKAGRALAQTCREKFRQGKARTTPPTRRRSYPRASPSPASQRRLPPC